MQILCIIAVITVAALEVLYGQVRPTPNQVVQQDFQALAAWDPGGNTPPNADAINDAAGVSAPIEPRANTTREGVQRITPNG